MTSTVFYVGEQPSDPLVIAIKDADGTARDLSSIVTASLVGNDLLPDGTASVSDAAAGLVQYEFSAAFATAENLVLQVKTVDGDGSVDYSAPFTLIVRDPADAATQLVTPAVAEATTGVPVSDDNIARAQGTISLVSGRDLSDSDWFAALSTADTFWLKAAISHQAAALADRETSGTVAMPYVAGAASVRSGDVAITYSGAQSAADVSANARLALSRLSWLRPRRSVTAKPYLRDGTTDPVLAVIPAQSRRWTA